MQTILNFSSRVANNLSSRLLLISALSLILSLSVADGQKTKKPPRKDNRLKHDTRKNKMNVTVVKAHLDVNTTGAEVNATLTFTNVSTRDAYLNRVNGCLQDKIQNNVFTIKSGEQIIQYTLPLAKRKDDGENDVVKIAPGQVIVTHLKLSSAYAFLTDKHTYTAIYEGLHYEPKRDNLLDLVSNKVSFVLNK